MAVHFISIDHFYSHHLRLVIVLYTSVNVTAITLSYHIRQIKTIRT